MTAVSCHLVVVKGGEPWQVSAVAHQVTGQSCQGHGNNMANVRG